MISYCCLSPFRSSGFRVVVVFDLCVALAEVGVDFKASVERFGVDLVPFRASSDCFLLSYDLRGFDLWALCPARLSFDLILSLEVY